MKTAYFAKSILKNLVLCFFAGWVLFQITYTARGGYLWKNSDIEDSTVSMMGEVLTGEAEKTVKDWARTVKLSLGGYDLIGKGADVVVKMPDSGAYFGFYEYDGVVYGLVFQKNEDESIWEFGYTIEEHDKELWQKVLGLRCKAG